jgi:small subunit ribosomal protein S5
MAAAQRRGGGAGGNERRDRRDRGPREEKNAYVERVVAINRVAKGVEEAKKHFFKVPRIQGTIPHPTTGEAAAGVVLLRPAAPGTGVIAGGPVRAVLECAGINDVLSKSLGSDNAINVVHATVQALRQLERPEEVAARRGLPLEDVAPAALLRARAAGVSG